MKQWTGMRAALLSRVSTDDQKDNGYSLVQQKDLLYDYCNKHNIDIVEHFPEDYTGTTIERPQIKKLRKLIKDKKIDLVLFHKWDRFSRQTVQGLVEIESIRAKRIEINAIAEYIDFAIPQNKLMLYIYLGLAEVENEVRSQRTKNGIIGALKEGRHVNKAPIGYLNGKDPNNPSKPLIQPCPEKAPLIKAIFLEYATGQYSQETLRKKYCKLGIKRSKSQFSNLLSNIKYSGKLIVPANNGKPITIVTALHEPIIDEATYITVQNVKLGKANIRFNAVKNNKHEEHLPLRGGILKCVRCGRNLTGSPAKKGKHYYYHCNRRKGCKENISVNLVHKELDVILNQLKPKEEVVVLFKAILEDEYKNTISDNQKVKNTLDLKLSSLQEKLDNLTEKFISDSIDKGSYERLRVKYSEQIDEIKIEFSKCSNIQSDIREYVDFGIQLLLNLNVFYNNARTKVKRKILGSIFSEKLVFENKKYRTAKLNEAVALIFNYNNGLQIISNKKGESISKLSYSVAGTGLEPVTFGL